MRVDLLALAGAGTVGAATAVAAVLSPAAWRVYRMTPRPVRRPAHARPARAQPAPVELVRLDQCDATDFYDCPREHARRPHAVSADGSRRCWSCGHPTPPPVPGETR